jgi:hypothetical protein
VRRRRIVFDEAEKVSNIFASFVSTRADGSFFNEVIRALPRGYLRRRRPPAKTAPDAAASTLMDEMVADLRSPEPTVCPSPRIISFQASTMTEMLRLSWLLRPIFDARNSFQKVRSHLPDITVLLIALLISGICSTARHKKGSWRLHQHNRTSSSTGIPCR